MWSQFSLSRYPKWRSLLYPARLWALCNPQAELFSVKPHSEQNLKGKLSVVSHKASGSSMLPRLLSKRKSKSVSLKALDSDNQMCRNIWLSAHNPPQVVPKINSPSGVNLVQPFKVGWVSQALDLEILDPAPSLHQVKARSLLSLAKPPPSGQVSVTKCRVVSTNLSSNPSFKVSLNSNLMVKVSLSSSLRWCSAV